MSADGCGHGPTWDDDCLTCETEIAEAKAAGALTPNEIGIYFRGKSAAAAEHLALVERVEAVLADMDEHTYTCASWNEAFSDLPNGPCDCSQGGIRAALAASTDAAVTP
jgi:hypothetical protein